MFYNGFTLLMQILAGATAYWVGNHFGYHRGETEMYRRCQRADAMVKEYFSHVSSK